MKKKQNKLDRLTGTASGNSETSHVTRHDTLSKTIFHAPWKETVAEVNMTSKNWVLNIKDWTNLSCCTPEMEDPF